jgi:hypothetical protein
VIGDAAFAETTLGGLVLGFAIVGGGLGIVLHVGLWFTFRKLERES